MRELEFLPDWYPQTRRRRRVVIVQAWMTLVMVAGLGLWMTLAQRNVGVAEETLAMLEQELDESRTDLRELDELLLLEKQYARQQQVLAKIGSHVEAARLLSTLEEVMPAGMALIDLSLQAELQSNENGSNGAGSGGVTFAQLSGRSGGGGGGEAHGNGEHRHMRVRLVGVAPTDVDVALFLTHLKAKGIFEAISMARSKERSEHGHVMREFEVTFAMDLTEPG